MNESPDPVCESIEFSTSSTVLDNSSPKYTSQSNIDLKKVQIIPEINNECDKMSITISSSENCLDISNNSLKSIDNNSIESLKSDFENISLSASVNEPEGNNEFTNEASIVCNTSTVDSKVILSEITIEPVLKKHDEVSDTTKVIQKTEIILRVNVPTTEAASQTENLETFESDIKSEKKSDRISNANSNTREKMIEEIECDKLSKDLIRHLSPTDKLYNILGM